MSYSRVGSWDRTDWDRWSLLSQSLEASLLTSEQIGRQVISLGNEFSPGRSRGSHPFWLTVPLGVPVFIRLWYNADITENDNQSLALWGQEQTLIPLLLSMCGIYSSFVINFCGSKCLPPDLETQWPCWQASPEAPAACTGPDVLVPGLASL